MVQNISDIIIVTCNDKDNYPHFPFFTNILCRIKTTLEFHTQII